LTTSSPFDDLPVPLQDGQKIILYLSGLKLLTKGSRVQGVKGDKEFRGEGEEVIMPEIQRG